MAPKVSIIILNWNGWEDTLECLEYLYKIDYPNYDIIVVDNDSSDESIQKIKEYCSGKIKVESPFFEYDLENKPITVCELNENELNTQISDEFLQLPSNVKLILIKNEKNYGFAEGNNVAIRFILKNLNSSYIFLLNNDTVVDKNYLKESVKLAESDEKIIVVGPKIYFYDFNGKNNIIQSTGGSINLSKFPGVYNINKYKFDYNINFKNIECDWTSGAALMMKINESPIKYLNKNLFFGGEDIELCLQLKEQGYKTAIAMNSKIWHKEGVSRKKRFSKSNKIKYLLNENKEILKFLKTYNKLFYLYLPIYIIQFTMLLFKLKLSSDKIDIN